MVEDFQKRIPPKYSLFFSFQVLERKRFQIFSESSHFWYILKIIQTDELATLKTEFLQNGFSRSEIECVIARHGKKPIQLVTTEDVIKGIVVIPYYGIVTNHLSWLLFCKGIQTVSRPPGFKICTRPPWIEGPKSV